MGCPWVKKKPSVWRHSEGRWIVGQAMECEGCGDMDSETLADVTTWDEAISAALAEAEALGGAS